MDRRSIDLKSISCQGVKSLTALQRPSLYATVSLSSSASDRRPLRQKTPVDRAGGENPVWDHPIRLYLHKTEQDQDRSSSLFLHIDLRTELRLRADKPVGSVQVPIVDLAAEGPTGVLRHVSYQVRAPDGRVNGVLRFSYILNEADLATPPPEPAELNTYPSFPDPDPNPNACPPVLPDQKPRFYPSIVVDSDPVIYPSLTPGPKPNFYPVIDPEPVMAYPGAYPVSYPQFTPDFYPPQHQAGCCYHAQPDPYGHHGNGWDGWH